VAVATGTAQAAPILQSLSWSGPTIVSADHPGAPVALNVYSPDWSPNATNSTPLGVIGCAPGICLLSEGSSEVYATPDPTGSSWTQVVAGGTTGGSPDPKQSAFSCVSKSFCAVAFTANDTLMFTATATPLAAQSWPAAIAVAPTTASGHAVTPGGLSCPSAKLCLALDRDGIMYWSTTPTVAGSWQSVPLLTAAGGTKAASADVALECPAAGLCFATNGTSETLVSTDPTGGAGAWKAVNSTLAAAVTSGHGNAGGGHALPACAGVRMCVFATASGTFYSSTTPAVAHSWKKGWKDTAGAKSGDAVTCPSRSRCMAVDGSDRLLVTKTPTNPRAWRTANSRHNRQHLHGPLYCWGPSSCLAAGLGNADIHVSTSWVRPSSTNTAANFERITCPSASLCMVVDSSGRLQSSSTPTSATPWTLLPIKTTIADVACASPSLCFARGTGGQVLRSDRQWRPVSQRSVAITCVQLSCYTLANGRLSSLSGPKLNVALPGWKANSVGAALTCTGPGSCLAVATYKRGETIWGVNGHTITRSATGGDDMVNPTVACMNASTCMVRAEKPYDDNTNYVPPGGALSSNNAFAARPAWSFTAKTPSASIRCFGSAGCTLVLDGAGSLTDLDDEQGGSTIYYSPAGSSWDWQFLLWAAIADDQTQPAQTWFYDVAETDGNWFVSAASGGLVTGVSGNKSCSFDAADAGCGIPNPLS
jgi:hypothetical protein